MSGNSRRIIDAITKHINKSPLLSNASSVIGNASERAQTKFIDMQTSASEKYNTIVKQVNGATIIQDASSSSLQPISPMPKRLIDWWQWYQQLTGLDTVELAKHHVIMVQDRLFKCQDQRRELARQYTMINDKLKEIYGELVQTKRDDPKYVQLTIMENKGLQEQTRISGQLNLLENDERDHFTQLATAIKEYHDSQAMNAQKYKYLSILASALIAIVSLTGSMVYNNRRITDVRNVIAEAQRNNDQTFRDCFRSLESTSKSKFSEIMTRLQNQATTDKFRSEDSIKQISESNESHKSLAVYLGAIVLALYILQQFVKS